MLLHNPPPEVWQVGNINASPEGEKTILQRPLVGADGLHSSFLLSMQGYGSLSYQIFLSTLSVTLSDVSKDAYFFSLVNHTF